MLVGGMYDADASSMLSDDGPGRRRRARDELDYEKAEKLLRLMGVQEQSAIRNLLGYRGQPAGRIMTSEFAALPTARPSPTPSS